MCLKRGFFQILHSMLFLVKFPLPLPATIPRPPTPIQNTDKSF